MMSIKTTMNIIIQYVILVFSFLGLVFVHNKLIGTEKFENPFKYSDINLSDKQQWTIPLLLFLGTLALMLVATVLTLPFELKGVLAGLIAIAMTSIASFFIIHTFNPLLGVMKEDRLSWQILKNHNFLLTIYLIICVELSFLNWVKEITTVQKPFLIFIVLYAILMMAIGIFLGIPKQNGDGKVFPKKWRWRSIILLDPIVIVLLTGIMVRFILDIISLIQ